MKIFFKSISCVNFLLLIASCISGVHCSKPENSEILASVNSDVISLKDFEENYFNTILYGNTHDSPQKRKQHLDFLIDAYILAQNGFTTGKITQKDVEKVSRRTTRRKIKVELFKQEVEIKTPVPDESDLKKLFSYTSQKLHVRHLFAKTQAEIDSLYELLQLGTDFEEIAYSTFKDSTLKPNGGDLGWCSYGDLDPFLEDTLFKMKHGRYSKPVQSRFGWHILKLENRVYNPLLTQSDFDQSREKLSHQFKKQEQDKLYYSFVNNFMGDKTAVIHNPQWSIVMQEIRKQYPPDQQVSPMLMQLPYSPEINSGSPSIQDILDDPIITFPDHEMTVNEFLDWVTDQPVKSFYGSLKIMTEQTIKDYFLVREGIRRDLHTKASLENAVIFEKNIFAGLKYRTMMLSRHLIDPDSLDSVLVIAAYDSLKENQFIKKTTVNYSQIVVSDSTTAMLCQKCLQDNIPFEQLIHDYGIPKVGVLESGRFTREYQEISGPIRQAIILLKDGKHSDWIKLNNRYVILFRHNVISTYHPLQEVESDLRTTLARNRSRSIVADSLTVWRKKSNIVINYTLLDSLYMN